MATTAMNPLKVQASAGPHLILMMMMMMMATQWTSMM
jgi:hypothetical protein